MERNEASNKPTLYRGLSCKADCFRYNIVHTLRLNSESAIVSLHESMLWSCSRQPALSRTKHYASDECTTAILHSPGEGVKVEECTTAILHTWASFVTNASMSPPQYVVYRAPARVNKVVLTRVKNWKPLRYVAKRKNVLPGFIKKETTTRLELDISWSQ